MTSVEIKTVTGPRRFDFERDRFGFANELMWEYRFDGPNGKTTYEFRKPRPDYTHRCFVLARAVRQFFYHARFEPDQPQGDDASYRRRVREVLGRDPRIRCPRDRQVVIPGYEGLREFSAARERMFKSECGGAWRSYALRSHWRMVFPISRTHQARTAAQLFEAIQQCNVPVIHLVRFPRLNMNHGMVLFAAEDDGDAIRFQAYDPNDPEKPSMLSFEHAKKTFSLPRNLYWSGGFLNIIEIYRSWWL
jgi:hypothetical protein